MIGIYPLLLIWAVVLIRRTKRKRGAGWVGFAVWTVAGAIFTFSLLTGRTVALASFMATGHATRRRPP